MQSKNTVEIVIKYDAKETARNFIIKDFLYIRTQLQGFRNVTDDKIIANV